ncbi:MAG TPA: molybdate ABC transporter substrate-binding protein [Tepidisphaeraceae bacterium]|jgi:molybdate transport system substrate-binding protein|nr:molybdate ABC transporter substrate-binding protein [Tepidisphaeraceae bacterium]
MLRSLRLITLTLLLSATLCPAATVTVSAAISLKESLTEIGKFYNHQSGDEVKVNVGASGQLMDQIKNGAPVDLFISASPTQVDELQKAGLTVDGTRRVVAYNQLVLITPPGSTTITQFADLTNDSVKRIAVGKPGAVPAGDYALQVFDHLHIAPQVNAKLVYGANVRQVLDYVRRGEVDAGIVYSTDAATAGDTIRLIIQAPADSHKPIEYVGVAIKGCNDATAKFLDFLSSDDAQRILKSHGFAVVQALPKTTH